MSGSDSFTNPYHQPNEISADPQDDVPQSPQKRPRVWTVFLTVLLALLATIVTQGVIAGAVVFSVLADGADPKDLQTLLIPKLMSSPIFIAMLIVGQLSMLATVLMAAKLSPVPWKERLGLVRPRCEKWAHGLFVLGSALPLALSVGAAYLMTKWFVPDESVKLFYEQMTSAWAIPFIVAIGLFPGVVEEVLFRGYVQPRFVERWGAWPGIIATSIIFAIFHITPHAMALALVIGLWLGVIAYRTGSVWSGALCHGCINSGWNVWQVGKQLWGFPETVSPTVAVVGIAVMVLLFALAIRVLVRPMREPKEEVTPVLP